MIGSSAYSKVGGLRRTGVVVGVLWLTHDCGTLQPCICAVQSEYLPIVFIHTACTFLYVPVTQLRMLDGHVYQCTLT